MKFDKWFREQFGVFEKVKITDLYKKRDELNKELERLNFVIQNKLEYDSMYKAARYAWNVTAGGRK